MRNPEEIPSSDQLSNDLSKTQHLKTETPIENRDALLQKSPPTKKTTSALIKPDPRTSNIPEVEVLWEIPQRPVNQFIVEYGFSKDALTQKKIIPISEVEKFHDPDFGYVYRCLLDNVPETARLFVRIGSEHENASIKFSSIFEIEPTSR